MFNRGNTWKARNFKGLDLVAERGSEKIFKCDKVHTSGKNLDTTGHLYYNEDKGVWHCFKCAADGRESGGRIVHDGTEHGKPPEIVLSDTLKIILGESDKLDKIEPPEVVSFEIAPYNVKAALAKYLSDRNLIYKDVVKYDLKYYSLSSLPTSAYGAIYIPFYEFIPDVNFNGDKKNFLTYYQLRFILGGSHTHLNPKGLPSYPKLYLNAWDYKSEPAILVEGVFDAIRLKKLGFSAIALCGKSLGLFQISKLLTLDATKYVILLDKDAITDATDNLNLLRPFTDKPVVLRVLTKDKDPASAPDETLKELLKDI